tara:strand:+ start:348 stop:656 length:309 start_codon:yes stop_codon:yes gene_type:complete
MTDKTLTVDTDEKRREWIELLDVAVEYHNDMAAELSDDDSIKFHSGIARAILESIWLIQAWELEEVDPYAKVVNDLPKDNELPRQREEFMEKVNERTTDSDN